MRLQAQPVEATVHGRVLVLVDKPGDAFMGRIKAEIVSLGLDVAVRAPVGSLDADARAEHAVAAIRMLPSRKGVEVWMADETSGRSLLRQVIVDETTGGPDQNLIALQTAELLRTSFFPKREPTSATASVRQEPPPAPPPIVLQAAPPQSSGEGGAQVAIGALLGAGGASASLQGWLSFQHLWGRQFGIGLTLSAPLRSGTLSGPEGTSDVGVVLVGGEVLARLGSHRFFLTPGLGGGLAVVLLRGHPSQEGTLALRGASLNAYTGVGYLRVSLGWRAARWLLVGATGLAGATTGRVHITFAGNDAGSWGVPLLGGALFGEVDWL
jgi:hypothetical protein